MKTTVAFIFTQVTFFHESYMPCMVVPLLSKDQSRADSWKLKFVSKQACNLPFIMLYLQLFLEHVFLQ